MLDHSAPSLKAETAGSWTSELCHSSLVSTAGFVRPAPERSWDHPYTPRSASPRTRLLAAVLPPSALLPFSMAVARVSMMALAAFFCATAPRALVQATTSSAVTVDDDTGSPYSGDVPESSPPNATSPGVELGSICDHEGNDAHYFEELE